MTIKKVNNIKNKWLKRHINDHFVQQAQRDHFRSRAVYKLIEIQEKDRIIQQNMTIIELGAAPGSWSQYILKILNHRGKLIAIDKLPMLSFSCPESEFQFIQGDFTDQAIFTNLIDQMTLQPNTTDLIVSDMAPDLSGHRTVDQWRTIALCEKALEFTLNVLKPRGNFLIKIFQGEGFTEYFKLLKDYFEIVITRKPKASRSCSRECYLLAKNLKPINTINI